MRFLLGLLACVLLQAPAHAQDVPDTLRIAWELFWQQAGYPRAIYKWHGPIRVKFTGPLVSRHREDAFTRLKEVADVAGVGIEEVAPDDPNANFEVEFVPMSAPLPENEPCVTNVSWRNGALQHARIRANDLVVWRCMSHEAMHAMGFPGHPMGDTVLTYFRRSGNLTDTDRLLLRAIYSNDVASGTSPFAALSAIARKLVEAAQEDAKPRAANAARTFLLTTVQQMEQFANGNGEPPSVVLRNSKATSAGIARGQTEMQYYLGLAYLNGHIVAKDNEQALAWLAKAAAGSHVAAQNLLRKLNAQQTAANQKQE